MPALLQEERFEPSWVGEISRRANHLWMEAPPYASPSIASELAWEGGACTFCTTQPYSSPDQTWDVRDRSNPARTLGGSSIMKAVLVLELRGLTQQAEVLVHELEHMSMNTERIRAATIDITKGAITRVSAAQHPEASGQQGTDTFYWTFPDVDSGAIFGSLLIADLWDKASRQGLYYVKPSLGLGWCEPQVSDSHLLDDGSLETYRVADGGRAFTLYLVADAIAKTAYPFLGPEEEARKAHVKVRPLDWQAAVASSTIDQSTVYIPPLLLDSDVVYSDTAAAALNVILSQQEASREILVFGGRLARATSRGDRRAAASAGGRG